MILIIDGSPLSVHLRQKFINSLMVPAGEEPGFGELFPDEESCLLAGGYFADARTIVAPEPVPEVEDGRIRGAGVLVISWIRTLACVCKEVRAPLMVLAGREAVPQRAEETGIVPGIEQWDF